MVPRSAQATASHKTLSAIFPRRVKRANSFDLNTRNDGFAPNNIYYRHNVGHSFPIGSTAKAQAVLCDCGQIGPSQKGRVTQAVYQSV